MLEVHGLTKKYGRTAALSDISFDIDAGICVVAGPNGSGKTTLLRTLVGAEKPSSGSVILDGNDVYADLMRAHRHMSYLSDAVPLYNDLTVEEHLTYRGRLKGLSGKRLRARLRHVSEAMDVKQLGTVRISALSSGEKKRVGIADSMLCETRALLIDEPFAGLDRSHVDAFLQTLEPVSKHAVVLLATHDLDVISGISGHCIVLYSGHLAGIIPISENGLPELRQRYNECVERARIAEVSL